MAPARPPLTAAIVIVLLTAFASSAFAQAPETGPLILVVPASARTAALGNAWVAGRDRDVIFYNPAQLIDRQEEFDLSLTRLGPASIMMSAGSIFAAGKWNLTLGWGAQVLGFNADAASSYPYSPDLLQADGSRAGTDTLLTVGGAIEVKGFRVGAAGKYVSEIASPTAAAPDTPAPNHQMVLVDIGIARDLFGGVGAIAFQNLGRDSEDNGTVVPVGRQVAFGWSRPKQAGPLDLAIFTQATVRQGWWSPSGGLEMGYSWIDGYNVALRVGGRRTETDAERPISLGGAFTADRLTVEYAVRFFDQGRTANGVTVRWR
jgi:hypothetical protein